MKLEQLKVGQRFEAIDLEGETLEVVEGGLLKIVEPEKGKYIPKCGERYWYIDDSGLPNVHTYDNDMIDRWIVNHALVFRTDEEVNEYKNYLDVLDKYKYEFSDEEWKDCNLEKWIIKYFYNNQTLHVFSRFVGKYSNCTHFKSKEDAKAFIKEVGEENVKRFMFDVWE